MYDDFKKEVVMSIHDLYKSLPFVFNFDKTDKQKRYASLHQVVNAIKGNPINSEVTQEELRDTITVLDKLNSSRVSVITKQSDGSYIKETNYLVATETYTAEVDGLITDSSVCFLTEPEIREGEQHAR